MPQLDSTTAERVSQAESTGGLMDAAWYEMILTNVYDADPKTGKALVGDKGPYWKWEFTMPEDAAKYKNWKQWKIISLAPESDGMMKDMFASFGADTTTNTDELIGKRVRVFVGVRTIQDGPNTGDKTNFVKKTEPLDGAVSTGKSTGASTAKATADNF